MTNQATSRLRTRRTRTLGTEVRALRQKVQFLDPKAPYWSEVAFLLAGEMKVAQNFTSGSVLPCHTWVTAGVLVYWNWEPLYRRKIGWEWTLYQVCSGGHNDTSGWMAQIVRSLTLQSLTVIDNSPRRKAEVLHLRRADGMVFGQSPMRSKYGDRACYVCKTQALPRGTAGEKQGGHRNVIKATTYFLCTNCRWR
jgi:hypothetical protein